MRWPNFSRRIRAGLLLFALAVAIIFFPLRLALNLSGADDAIAARQVRGSVWSGRIDDLTLGGARGLNLGTVQASVSPVQLVVGRMRLDLWREQGAADDIAGAWTLGFNQRGIDDVTGSIATADLFAPLPLNALELEDVTVHFAGETCSRAEGRVRARVSGQYAGLSLSQGLSGVATCDGKAVLLPLVSQTGMERLSLRIRRDGHYSAQLAIKSGEDSQSAAALAALGMTRNGDAYVLTLEGQM